MNLRRNRKGNSCICNKILKIRDHEFEEWERCGRTWREKRGRSDVNTVFMYGILNKQK